MTTEVRKHASRTVKFFCEGKMAHRFMGMEAHKESVALAFQKLNLAAIHEWGEWTNNHF